MEGQMWKTWRSIFNPDFSSHHLMTLVLEIMEDVMIFRDILREHVAKANMFALEDAALNITMDVIGRVALDVRFNIQQAYNDMTAPLHNQIRS
ncbi:hypothetical protein MMC31_007056, partial [Peltigera leucophlebia]|nr:hypothetical protein [Peltigera leucophlebia]